MDALRIAAEMPLIGRVDIPFSRPVIRDSHAGHIAERLMRSFCRKERQRVAATNRCETENVVATMDERIGYLNGRPVERLVVTVQPRGCAWGKVGGGCVMCGHHLASTGEPPLSSAVVAEFSRVLDQAEERSIPILCIYNGGSVLNSQEFPSEALDEVFRLCSRRGSLRRIVIEARPEFIEAGRLDHLKALLRHNQTLVVATGVETSNDDVRRLCVNKGFSWDFLRKVLHGCGTEFRCYVLFGAPFLTEAEVISDAYATIMALADLQPEEIHIEAATIQRGTALSALWRNSSYDLPSLWSLAFLLRALPASLRVYVSPFNHFPMPDLMPTSCRTCGEQMRRLFDAYNRECDATCFDAMTCQCIDTWKRRIEERDERPLEQRIMDGIHRLLPLRESRRCMLEEWWTKYSGMCEIDMGSSGMQPVTISELLPEGIGWMGGISVGDTVPAGTDRLRDSIAALYEQASRENCLVTVGGTEALRLAFEGIDPMSRIAVFSPCYPPLSSMPRQLGHEVIDVPLRFTGATWAVDRDSFAQALSQSPDAFVINSPNNPTGVILPMDVMEQVIEKSQREGLWLIADESFLGLAPPSCRASLYGCSERLLVVSSTSKDLGLPGIRIGWLVGPREFIAGAVTQKTYTTLSTSVLDQELAVRALTDRERILERQRHLLDVNVRYVCQACEGLSQVVSLAPPEGGACCFPQIRGNVLATALAAGLAENHKVFVMPGDVFRYPRHFRLGLGGVPLPQFARGINAVCEELLRLERGGVPINAC